MASKLHLELALTPDGWRRDVVVRIDHGVILGLEEPGRSEAQRVSGVVLPGLPNLHSHAFQRAMAGLTERDRKSTRLNSSHTVTSYAVFCLKKKKYRVLTIHTLSRNALAVNSSKSQSSGRSMTGRSTSKASSFILMIRPQPRSTPFPYTTLFR